MTATEGVSTGDPDAGNPDADRTALPVDVYWRPGCPYCAGLRTDLDRRGVVARWHDIWADDEARAVVRRANHGNETVPTVRVGEHVLTNPSGEVVAALATGQQPPRPSWLMRLLGA